MNGPEHYREAERHLSWASFTNGPDGDPVNPPLSAHHLAIAQVHATLALAAATALRPSQYAVGRPEFEQWRSAAAVEKRAEAES